LKEKLNEIKTEKKKPCTALHYETKESTVMCKMGKFLISGL
jgi:hypothetical protein